jgi:uncharacterized protein (TIGR03067 family)
MNARTAALLAAVLVAVADAPKEDPVKKDLKGLEGTWLALSAEEDGKKAPAKEVKGMRMVFEGKKFTAYFGPIVLMQGTVKLDPGKKPKAMDLVSTAGRLMGQTAPAIYELDGDGLKVCLGEPDGKRPTEFKANKIGQHLILYQRKKP